MRFPGFWGNSGLKSRLTAAQHKLSHCFILEGPAGSGKKTLARILAAAMECQSPNEIPCGVCPACKKVFDGIHPDVATVDSDTATIPIRLIRDMQTDAYTRPNEGNRKIYLLPRAQDMLLPAQNALLKLLEEPPAYCAFLLMTDNAEKLLPTVRSRAVTLTLYPLSQPELEQSLKTLAPDADPDALASAMEKSEGYLGAALSLLESPDTAKDQEVLSFLEAFASGDEMQLLSALVPLEKYKRQELLELLQQLHRAFTRAMSRNATREQLLLSRRCSREVLFAAAEATSHAITLLQANGSNGHAVGLLMAELRTGFVS